METKYKVNMKNCYGIPALTHEFSFASNNAIVAIYAPNGSMKTSFARSFRDYSQQKSPKDIVYPDRKSVFKVQDQDNAEIPNETIFVVESINESYSSEKISSLLASKKLQTEYEAVFGAIKTKQDALLTAMKKKTKMTAEVEQSFISAFEVPENDFITALGTVEHQVNRNENEELSDVIYMILFDPQVISLLEDEEMKQLILRYSEVYDQLLDESEFFRNGVFTRTDVNQVAISLKDDARLGKGHSVLNLARRIEKEKQRILKDPTLGQMLSKVSGKLNTEPLQRFRDYLIDHPYLVQELQNVNRLKRRLWIAYLTTMRLEYTALLSVYNENHERLNTIIEKAESERTRWEAVISNFNRRFLVPFEVKVKNKADAVLGIETPQIKFVFKDSDGNANQPIQSEVLSRVLSDGERRARYILNIIFELTALQADRRKTLIIVDDIADSFDYKNKYAIVEYLRKIARTDHFHLIVLTHNFDFYRTVIRRLGVDYKNRLIAKRFDNEIVLGSDLSVNDPMKALTRDLGDPKNMIGCIPFVRNLAEYCGHHGTRKKLTSLLHVKTDSDSYTFNDLRSVFQTVLSEEITANCYSSEEPILKQLRPICDEIVENANPDEISLLDKTILSIGIRIETERRIIKKLPKIPLEEIKRNQTHELIERYRSKYPSDDANGVFERVSLMTPENIHMNSFMFEPIIDMAPYHLHTLYNDVLALN